MENNKITLDLEDLVIIVIVFIGLVLGCIFYFYALPLSAVFISLSLSAMLYRFLGGIAQSTKFSIGLFKLGGSAAFLIGCIFFLTDMFAKYGTSGLVVESPAGNWYPVQESTGLPDTIKIETADGLKIFHCPENLQLEYITRKEKNGYLALLNQSNPNFCIGKTKYFIRELKSISQGFLYPLPGDQTEKKTTWTPSGTSFTVRYEGYNFGIVDNKGNYIKDVSGDLIRGIEPVKGIQRVFCIDDQIYFLIVLHANHQNPKPSQRYTKFLTAKISIEK